MSEITLGQIQNVMVWIVGFCGALFAIIKAMKKAIDAGFKPISDKIDKVDKAATMNYLTDKMDEIEKGTKLDGVSRKRFFEQYEHYTGELKGNTYIHEEFERLKKEGKL